MRKNLYFYSILLALAFVGIWLIAGDTAGTEINEIKSSSEASAKFIDFGALLDKMTESPGILILQLIVIMLAARLMGYLFQRAGQPLVIGEIIAGLLLGPSVLGSLSPQFSAFLFPPESIYLLQQLSQLGLIFFMFIIGMELDSQSLRSSANKAVLISIASIVIPFLSGIILAMYLQKTFMQEGVEFSSFALFMGTTMCITAFPILARIVQERKLTKTSVGVMAITVAAIGDVVAWCILAVVIAIVKSGGISHSLLTIGLSVIYILFMFYVVKPFMYRIGRVYASREAMVKPIVALVFLLILVSSLITETLGIHALFGAFMAGVVMPENLSFKRVFTEKMEDISLVILLPLFFVSTGLRTEIGLINSPHLWYICILIIIVAIIGKFGGTLIASRFTGLSWNHSLSLSVLMNAKGLMELIVLNIGYELGILTPEIFTMLVIMALATTLITGPGLNLFEWLNPRKEKHVLQDNLYRIMLSFANPKMGGTLLNLTRQLIAPSVSETVFTALHISPRSDLTPDDAKVFEKESFAPVRKVADKFNLSMNTIYLNTSDIHGEIIRTSRRENPDFLILGSARTVFSTDILGGKLKHIIAEAPCDVLIFNEKNFSEIHSVLIVYFGNGDDFIFEYARLLNYNPHMKFFAYHRGFENPETANAISNSGIPVEPVSGSLFQPELLRNFDLVMVSEMNWRALEDKQNLPVSLFPSLLIIHKSEKITRILNQRK